MSNHGLENAPEDVKLAVDLIYLLESNEIAPQTALRALEMVKKDLERKLAQES
ncbi:pleiotropic regulatory protein RsmS [Enterovibrio coralii]|nr:pleiotropic regulatory protein RsmS [Enterovibrio coralii]